MRVVNLTSSVSRLAGGLFECVRHLAQETLIPGKCDVTVLGLRDHYSDADLPNWKQVEVRLHEVRISRTFKYSPSLFGGLLDAGPDILHVHGIWQYPSVATRRWARHTGRPFIVSPHGMLEPWAWGHQAWKKRPVWWLWERHNLHCAAVLHATSNKEAEGFRALGLRAPIAVIPNGVELPPNPRSPLSAPHSSLHTALFLSRIHPKKGLLNLVAAWKQVRPSGWRMVVCGPDERDHEKEVKTAVAEAGLREAFEFAGPVHGAEKDRQFASADLFILPTFSENFGISIAEALASGLPVITTTGAPWEELLTHRCGWWVRPTVEPLAAALREATMLDRVSLRQMGMRGRQLVRDRYSWPKIAAEMRSVYQWVQRQGPRPGCVQAEGNNG